MEPKKSKKADIEQYKLTYFSVGLIVSISLALIAFEWSVPTNTDDTFVIRKSREIATDIIPNTQEKSQPKPPEVRPPEFIRIVKDNTLLNTEIDWGTDIINEGGDIVWDGLYVPEPDVPDDTPRVFVSEMPGFKGGTLADFSAWVQKNIRYPVLAAQNGVEEKIYLTFVVERDGTISSTEITRGIDASLKEEVMRIMAKSPKWSPGSNMGIPARVRFSMVVNFKLQK